VHDDPQVLLNNLKKDLDDVIKRIIILPLAHEIHMDLAFHIHHDTRVWKFSLIIFYWSLYLLLE
jgi:hypothetical protein